MCGTGVVGSSPTQGTNLSFHPMSTIQEKIDGLIALMQNAASYPNEKTQARKALERICAKHDLHIEDVLQQEHAPQKFIVRCKNELEADVFAQTAFRYAEPVQVGIGWKGKNYIVVICKPSKFAELMTAWSVLKIAWREEQETFKLAFFGANGLFGKRKEGQPAPELTEEERRQAERAGAMATFVKSAQIHKQLSSPRPADND